MQSVREYFCLEPSRFRLDGGAMFGIIPRPLWNKVHPSDDQNRIDLALRLLVIKTENKVILIDTGIGDHNDEKFNERFDVRSCDRPLYKSLEKINLHPDDVTDLILSHLHFDHIGGIGEIVDGETVAVFKNATCHIHKTHYDYSLSPTLRDSGSFHQKNFLPIIDWYKNNQQLKFHTGEEGEIISLESDSIKFKCSHGHTPFLMHPFDSKFIYLADLIPTSNHVHIPWVMGYDISPGVTTEDKVKFLDFIKDEDLTVIYEHDPIYWGSKIAQGKRSLEAQQLIKAPESEAYRLEL